MAFWQAPLQFLHQLYKDFRGEQEQNNLMNEVQEIKAHVISISSQLSNSSNSANSSSSSSSASTASSSRSISTVSVARTASSSCAGKRPKIPCNFCNKEYAAAAFKNHTRRKRHKIAKLTIECQARGYKLIIFQNILNERPKNVFCLETPPTATISKIKEALALSEQFGPKYQQILRISKTKRTLTAEDDLKNTDELEINSGDLIIVQINALLRAQAGNYDFQEPPDTFGCTPCFCFDHSSICYPADGFNAVNITSEFFEEWLGGSELRPEDVQWAQLDKAAAVSQLDLVLPIFSQGNPLPDTEEQHYRFRIHAKPSLQWSPTLRELDYISVLSNVSAIKVRGTYSKGDVGFLSNFTFGSASLTPTNGAIMPADWVEQCKCMDAHVGQFCESCSHGYKRAHKFGGPLTKCITFECHDHSDSCDAESGVCNSQHGTAGDTCERCSRGYYDSLVGTEEDCKKCIYHTIGWNCEQCFSGYWGDALAEIKGDYKSCNCYTPGTFRPTQDYELLECRQSDGQCNSQPNVIGQRCEQCSPGFFNILSAQEQSVETNRPFHSLKNFFFLFPHKKL